SRVISFVMAGRRSAVGPLERAHVVLPLWCCQGRLQFRRQLQRQSAIRNDPVDAALVPDSTHGGIFQYSSLFLSPATDCTLRLRTQLICRDNENRIRNRIWDICIMAPRYFSITS